MLILQLVALPVAAVDALVQLVALLVAAVDALVQFAALPVQLAVELALSVAVLYTPCHSPKPNSSIGIQILGS